LASPVTASLAFTRFFFQTDRKLGVSSGSDISVAQDYPISMTLTHMSTMESCRRTSSCTRDKMGQNEATAPRKAIRTCQATRHTLRSVINHVAGPAQAPTARRGAWFAGCRGGRRRAGGTRGDEGKLSFLCPGERIGRRSDRAGIGEGAWPRSFCWWSAGHRDVGFPLGKVPWNFWESSSFSLSNC
jgi:hypothetical protein